MPELLDGPPARGRVLVVAPHPDDELIGPGGTLLLHRDAGDPIAVVVLTDGGGGTSGGDAAAYRATRESETREASRRLGAELVEFLGFPDGTRARAEDLPVVVGRLREVFERFGPEVVYAPHPGEVHADHHVASLAVSHALVGAPGSIRAFGYEIWTALTARWVVDVSAVMPEKLAIARCYRSQLRETDLLHFFGGLNAYRAVYLPKGARYGEAFCELPSDGSGS